MCTRVDGSLGEAEKVDTRVYTKAIALNAEFTDYVNGSPADFLQSIILSKKLYLVRFTQTVVTEEFYQEHR
jgi:hypothetical protein